MSSPVSYTLEGRIGVISVNNPPVNALSQAVRQGIYDAIAEAESDASKAVLIVCEGRTFIAGADISEFGKPPAEPWLPEVFDRLEALDKPVIAAIHGTALGGGFETALAAHYRCALPSAKIGLPEVMLGLLPGAGGTQRVPRLAGVEAAAEQGHGRPFAKLGTAQQDALLRALERGTAAGWPEPAGPSPVFFETVRVHTIVGFLADPKYGGNRDFAGWRVTRYPGPRHRRGGYTPEQVTGQAKVRTVWGGEQ